MRIQPVHRMVPEGVRESWICRQQDGMATLISLMALSIFTLLGLYMSLGATTELRIADNFESNIEARYAAQAGLNHARELLRGPRYDDFLLGPDGTYDNDIDNLIRSRAVSFRNPVSWATARSLNIFDPTSDVSGMSDDGIISTGSFGTTNGTVLVPITGIAQTAPNPYGTGTITTSRYLVKVTDNNGDAAELLGDPADNPFLDGDGEIIVRSFGVSKTIREESGNEVRANSVAGFEARFRQRSTFDFDSPFVVQGNNILPTGNSMFNGNAFRIDGFAVGPGIATIDTDTLSGGPLPVDITDELAPNQENNIQGTGGSPSVADITADVSADPDSALLLDPDYLNTFVDDVLPQYADGYFSGNQDWAAGTVPDIGYYDVNASPNDPSQRPRITYVDGDLRVSGNISGGGMLVVRGRLDGNGSLTYNGLILVVGEGIIDLGGMNLGVHGGIYVAKVVEDPVTGISWFGDPQVTFAGNSDVYINSDAIQMGVRLLPPVQIGFREITSMIDP